MGDESGGPGWWEADDGKWYPPELHPDVRNSRPLPPPNARSSRGWRRPGLIVGGICALALASAATGWALAGRADASPAHASQVPPTTISPTADRDTQSALRNALTAGRIFFADHGSFSDMARNDLQEIEPSLNFIGAEELSTRHDSVSVDIDPLGGYIVYAAMSDTGRCFYVGDGSSETEYGFRVGSSTELCTAANLTDVHLGGWFREQGLLLGY